MCVWEVEGGGEAEQDRQVIASRGFELDLSVMRLNKRNEREELSRRKRRRRRQKGEVPTRGGHLRPRGDASAAPFLSDFLRRRY